MASYIVTCLCLALFAGAHAAEIRIVGGTSTTIQEFPFQVSLRANGQHFCGGSIIGQRHILTAGYCFYNTGISTSRVTVVTGSTSSVGSIGKAYRIARVNVHPDYNGLSNNHNDLCVLTLSSAITLDASTKIINLPARDTPAGTKVMLSGWGLLSANSRNTPSTLQKATTTVLGNSACSTTLRNIGVGSISNEQLCTYQRVGVGACNGDSGGPLSVNNEVVGIVSFGIPCAKGYPDVFTRVYSYKSWIQNIIASS